MRWPSKSSMASSWRDHRDHPFGKRMGARCVLRLWPQACPNWGGGWRSKHSRDESLGNRKGGLVAKMGHPQIRYKWTISQDTCKVFKFLFWRGFGRWIQVASNQVRVEHERQIEKNLTVHLPLQQGLLRRMPESMARYGKVVKWTRRRSLCLTEIDWVVSWKVHACHSPARPACQGLQQKLHPCHVTSQNSNGMFYHEYWTL